MIRPVERGDIPALAALEAACFPDPWNETGLGMLLGAPYGGLCAEQDGVIVGYVGWMYIPAGNSLPAEAEITRIAVAPAARRQGLGRALLEGMLAMLCPDDGALTVYLDVRESNRAAQALYESLGFARQGTRPRFYGDEDAREYALHCGFPDRKV
ncbi:MAG: ribosomal protein S18-alanine N-acetyltransferase [Clostridia bacterium]|nr:ribosomal protein S18-alanine N-acetyltransferase [Clostridia bacterium]